MESDRRPGDPAALFVDPSRLKRLTGWAPEHDDLDFIIRSAWDWEKRLKRKRPQNHSTPDYRQHSDRKPFQAAL